MVLARKATRAMMLLSALVLFGGCGESGPVLFVDLLTDLRPAVDFSAVTLRVTPAAGGEETLRQYVFTGGGDFSAGVRIGSLPLAAGDYRVALSALSGGAAVAAQETLVSLTADRTVTMVISRDCVDVTCPTAADPSATSCIGGRCVDPSCVLVDATCAAECRAADECPTSGCASATCAAGTCLYFEDDSRCGAGERCDLAAGCTGDVDAGADAAADGGMSDAPMDTGSVDAGADAPFDGGVDAGPVACPGRWPDPVSRCDPKDNSGCSAGRTCVPNPTAPGETHCVAVGGAGVGGTCGGSRYCQSGLVCQAFLDSSNPRCRPQCASGAGCTCPDPSDSCFSLVGTTYGACHGSCDPIANTGCAAGQDCVRSVFGTSCEINVGTAGIGDACSIFTDCAPGGYCLIWNDEQICVENCRLGEAACTCRSEGTSDEYGFCVP